MNKYILAALVIVAVLAVGLLSYRVFFSGPEDTWLCENGEWIKHGNPSAPMPEMGCGGADESDASNNKQTAEDEPVTGMANPASTYCIEQGGALEIREGSGGQYGICILKDGTECEEWDFLRGKCGPNSIDNLAILSVSKLVNQINRASSFRSALAIYEMNEGQYPNSLDDLSEYIVINEDTLDVFTGKSFVYERKNNDYELRYYMDLSYYQEIYDTGLLEDHVYQDEIANAVNGWNTATREYLSKEGGH
jgi:putative hemolysin